MQAVEESQSLDELGAAVSALFNLELFDSVLWWNVGNKFNELTPPDQLPTPEHYALILRLQTIPLWRNLCDVRVPQEAQKDREVGKRVFLDSFVFMKVL